MGMVSVGTMAPALCVTQNCVSVATMANTSSGSFSTALYTAIYLGDNLRLKMLTQRIDLVSKRFFGVPTFFNYAIADGLYNLLFADKTGINNVIKTKKPEFQLCFNFWEEAG